MRSWRAALALLLLALGPASAAEGGCGEARSFAEVAEGSRGRGPVVVGPGRLCAETDEPRRPALDLQVVLPPPGAAGPGEAAPRARR